MIRTAPRRAALALLAVPLVLLPACTLLRPLDGLTCETGRGNASCRYGDRCESDADCATTSCTDGSCQCPEGMAAVTVGVDDGFCIDVTEVSNGVYKAFLGDILKSGELLQDQDEFCSWNDSFEFDAEAPSCPGRATGDEHPASCIDWCDARAFCKSLGKRLCGAVDGGPNPPDQRAKEGASQWYTACSGNGMFPYPTGEEYEPKACNGESDSGAWPVDPRTDPQFAPQDTLCETGSLGVFHMSGNVREWEDSCSGSTGDGDDCLTRGGAFDVGGMAEDGTYKDLACDFRDPRKRSDTDATIGFRCCGG